LIVGQPLRLPGALCEPELRCADKYKSLKELAAKVPEFLWSKQKAATRLSVTANCEIRLLLWILSFTDC
jgi:hypothetical protein